MYCNALKLNSSHHPAHGSPDIGPIQSMVICIACIVDYRFSFWMSLLLLWQSILWQQGRLWAVRCWRIMQGSVYQHWQGWAQYADVGLGLEGGAAWDECCDQNYRSGVLTLASPPLSSAHCYPIQPSLNPDYNNAIQLAPILVTPPSIYIRMIIELDWL